MAADKKPKSKLSIKKEPNFSDEPADYFDCSLNSFDSEVDGVYIILKGVCHVTNRADKYEVCKLYKGDSFGECEMLRICDPTFYGDIYAESEVHIMYLTYENFQKIPLFEIENVYENLYGKYSAVNYTVSKRYKVDSKEFNNL